MASNKFIHQLSGNTNPSLTGFTVFDNNTATTKVSLSTLRQTLVDSGSHYFTGSQIINGNLTVTGSQTINGNLIVTGSLTAQSYIVSSSVYHVIETSSSGSSKFGNDLTDTHTFTGSINVSGSINSPYFISTNLNNGENYKVGDNVWLGDIGMLDTLVVKGQNDTGSGYIKFGLANTHQNPYIGHDSGEDANVLSINADTTKFSNAVIVGGGELIAGNPEMLHVNSSGSYNIAYFVGDTNTYSQINVKNTNSSAGASSDIVATADNGTEDLHYVNMGINSSGFDTPFSVGYQNDAYVINRGRNLYLGSLDGPDSNNTHVYLFSSNSWQEPQISLLENKKVAFNTGSVSSGFTYEFSGSVKLQDDLNVQGNQIISGSKYLAVETIQNLSGSLNLITAGGNVEILASNLNVPNGGIITNFNVSASAFTGSLDWLYLINVPSLVSGSSQISYSGLTGIPSGIISGSSQLPSELVSGSSQISYTGITDIPNGLISGSSQISDLGYTTTGSNTFVGDQTINASLIIKSVSEVLTIDGGFNGNRDFDYTSGSIFYLTGVTGNGTWNVNSVPTDNNKAITLTFIISQGVTPYSGSQYQINSSNVTVKWADNEIPTGSANNVDVIGLTAFRVGSSWDVLGSLSTFG